MALEWYEDYKEEQNIYIDDSISLVITDIPFTRSNINKY